MGTFRAHVAFLIMTMIAVTFIGLYATSGRSAVPAEEPSISSELSEDQILDYLLDKHVSRDTIEKQLREGMADMPANVAILLPEGFVDQFTEEMLSQLPAMKERARKVYKETYTTEELAVLYEVNRKYPWMSNKAMIVSQKITAYTSELGSFIGREVGEKLAKEQER